MQLDCFCDFLPPPPHSSITPSNLCLLVFCVFFTSSVYFYQISWILEPSSFLFLLSFIWWLVRCRTLSPGGCISSSRCTLKLLVVQLRHLVLQKKKKSSSNVGLSGKKQGTFIPFFSPPCFVHIILCVVLCHSFSNPTTKLGNNTQKTFTFLVLAKKKKM